eukprot:UN16465
MVSNIVSVFTVGLLNTTIYYNTRKLFLISNEEDSVCCN